jgi:hypothetical protein
MHTIGQGTETSFAIRERLVEALTRTTSVAFTCRVKGTSTASNGKLHRRVCVDRVQGRIPNFAFPTYNVPSTANPLPLDLKGAGVAGRCETGRGPRRRFLFLLR